MDKRELLALVIEYLEKAIDMTLEQSKTATETAKTYPGGGKSHSDTYKFQYQEQAQILELAAQEMRGDIDSLRFHSLDLDSPHREIQLGSIVRTIDEGGIESTFFLIPGNYGQKVQYRSEEVFAIHLGTPMGKILLGHKPGDRVVLEIGSGKRLITILSVQ